MFFVFSYAPWCPACKALEPIWESLALRKRDLKINVGKIDVTDAPGLSGRFMVTALPTIYQYVIKKIVHLNLYSIQKMISHL